AVRMLAAALQLMGLVEVKDNPSLNYGTRDQSAAGEEITPVSEQRTGKARSPACQNHDEIPLGDEHPRPRRRGFFWPSARIARRPLRKCAPASLLFDQSIGLRADPRWLTSRGSCHLTAGVWLRVC